MIVNELYGACLLCAIGVNEDGCISYQHEGEGIIICDECLEEMNKHNPEIQTLTKALQLAVATINEHITPDCERGFVSVEEGCEYFIKQAKEKTDD